MESEEDRISRHTQRVLADTARSLGDFYKRELQNIITQNANLRRDATTLRNENWEYSQQLTILTNKLSSRSARAAANVVEERPGGEDLMGRISQLQERLIAAIDDNSLLREQNARVQGELENSNRQIQTLTEETTRLAERDARTNDAVNELQRSVAKVQDLEARLCEEQRVYRKDISQKDRIIEELEQRIICLEGKSPKHPGKSSSAAEKENEVMARLEPLRDMQLPSDALPLPNLVGGGYEARFKDLKMEHSRLKSLYDQLKAKTEADQKELQNLKTNFKVASHRFAVSRERWETFKETLVKSLNKRLVHASKKRRLSEVDGVVDVETGNPQGPQVMIVQDKLGEMDDMDQEVYAAHDLLMKETNLDQEPTSPLQSPGCDTKTPRSKRFKADTRARDTGPQALHLAKPNSPTGRPERLRSSPCPPSSTANPDAPSSPSTATESEPPLSQLVRQRMRNFLNEAEADAPEPAHQTDPLGNFEVRERSPVTRIRDRSRTPTFSAPLQARTEPRPTSRQEVVNQHTSLTRTVTEPIIKSEPLDDIHLSSPLAEASRIPHTVHSRHPGVLIKQEGLARACSSPPDSPHRPRIRKAQDPAIRAVLLGKRKEAEPVARRVPVSSSSRHRDDPRTEDEESGDDEMGQVQVAESSTRHARDAAQTREEREKYVQALKNKPHSEYVKAYAPYKGRGRYAAQAVTRQSSEAIGALYEINETRNQGLDYQFDAVVRNKDQRKRLDASDCECCKDYYNAVGPLPPITRGPAWLSPTPEGNPHRKRPCVHATRDGDFGDASTSLRRSASDSMAPPSPSKQRIEHDQQMADHRRDISRHRHNWARAQTPPGYWNIGFPTTQELAEINRRGEENNREKRRAIEREAQKPDGRYRRRGA